MGIVENTYAELKQQELKNNPYSCLHMADIDINPHQVEAFTFALSSLEFGGAILADEVGLGKTIEAGLVIKYLLCSGKNKILLIMPSNLRKQWQVELEEKFDIDSLIVDSSNWEDYFEEVKSKQAVIIVSYHFASKRKTEFGKIAWDFCVFDEAHRLRNVYKNGSKMANSLYELTKGIPKIVFNVQKDLIVFKSFAKNMRENGRLNFKKEVPDKKNIKQYLFEGYKKSYYAENAFDSDDERRLSVVLEEDSEVIRFIKPPLNQLGLFYKAAKQYNPDFLVETADKKYMIEVKAANQTDNEDVQEKAKAAIKWCECASQVDADGKTWEYRLVPGDKIIVGNTFKYVIGMAIPVVVDGE